jgi:hypothetical protein
MPDKSGWPKGWTQADEDRVRRRADEAAESHKLLRERRADVERHNGPMTGKS